MLGYGSGLIDKTGNLVKLMPKTLVAFFAGFAGVSGFPPFGIFIGEMFIIIGAFRTGHYIVAAIFIISLCVVFAGFASQAIKMTFGDANKNTTIKLKEKASMIWPQYILLLTSLILCLWIPDTLYKTITDAICCNW